MEFIAFISIVLFAPVLGYYLSRIRQRSMRWAAVSIAAATPVIVCLIFYIGLAPSMIVDNSASELFYGFMIMLSYLLMSALPGVVAWSALIGAGFWLGRRTLRTLHQSD